MDIRFSIENRRVFIKLFYKYNFYKYKIRGLYKFFYSKIINYI